jgi:hypothetical protein
VGNSSSTMPLINQQKENMLSLAKNSMLSTLERNGNSTRKQLSANTKKFKQRCEAYFETKIDPVDLEEAKDP